MHGINGHLPAAAVDDGDEDDNDCGGDDDGLNVLEGGTTLVVICGVNVPLWVVVVSA